MRFKQAVTGATKDVLNLTWIGALALLWVGMAVGIAFLFIHSFVLGIVAFIGFAWLSSLVGRLLGGR